MDNQPTIWSLSDAELDAVTGGRNSGNSGTIVQIVEISIGQIVAVASGNSTITFSLAGIGNIANANASSHAHHRH